MTHPWFPGAQPAKLSPLPSTLERDFDEVEREARRKFVPDPDRHAASQAFYAAARAGDQARAQTAIDDLMELARAADLRERAQMAACGITPALAVARVETGE